MVLGRGIPTVRHDSRREAEAEAERLARNNPGETFHVLAAVAAHRFVQTVRVSLDGLEEDGGLPF